MKSYMLIVSAIILNLGVSDVQAQQGPFIARFGAIGTDAAGKPDHVVKRAGVMPIKEYSHKGKKVYATFVARDRNSLKRNPNDPYWNFAAGGVEPKHKNSVATAETELKEEFHVSLKLPAKCPLITKNYLGVSMRLTR